LANGIISVQEGVFGLDGVEDASEKTLHFDCSSDTDAKFGCSFKFGQFTAFKLESGICEINVKGAKVRV
jgi:hypothetical protein